MSIPRSRYQVKKVNTLDGPRFYVLKVISEHVGWAFSHAEAEKKVKELRAKK